MAPNSTIQALLLGGFGIVSVSVLFYFMFWKKPAAPPALKDKPAEKAEQKVEEVPQKKQPVSSSSVQERPAVIVEDADSDDDEENDVDESSHVDVELEALKSQYEDANRLASKLIAGQKYEKAVEKLSEALELAPRVPNASKDIMTLYNNRSAMYEKLNLFDKSLSDITVILTMDPFHLKARVRRARVYEAQEKYRQALDDYVFASLVEQRNGTQPSHQLKVETLGKQLALKETPALFKRLRSNTAARPLPSKSHCKNFLESYPSVHLWIDHYEGVKRGDLEAALAAAQANEDGDIDAVTKDSLLRQRQLDLICFDLVNTEFESAFALLQTMTAAVADASLSSNFNNDVPITYLTPYDNTNTLQLLSLQYELIGFERQLRCDLSGSVAAFTTALLFYPNNVDARLKLANVYLEVPTVAECGSIFADLMAHFDSIDGDSSNATSDKDVLAVMRAWTLLHRISLFVTRNDAGGFVPTAIADSQRDVDEALALTESLQHTLAGKAARVTALIRSVHIVIQSKPMLGEAVTEEDADRCKETVVRAKQIAPHNDSVIMIDAELLNNEGRVEEALSLIETAARRPGAIVGDCTPYCLRASITINKAMSLFQNATSQDDYTTGQALFKDAEDMYKKALELEPQAIEALNQYAQYCGMSGQLDLAVSLLRQALPLARTRDDVHDLNQALILNEAQAKAVDVMRTILQIK